MKIGVMTVHDAANFGAFLQAYAMKKTLEGMGHEVYFIQSNSEKYIRNLYYKYPATRRSLQHPIEEFQKYLYGKEKWKRFQEARKDFKVVPLSDVKKLDQIVIGSDEMWNIKEPIFRNPLYFGKGMPSAFTYGISMGRADYADFQKSTEIYNAIKELKNILVRDKKTQKIVTKITGTVPDMVSDPTFLYPAEKMRQPLRDDYCNAHRCLLVYTYPFTMDDKIKNYIIKFARKNNLKIVSAGFYFAWCDYCINCNPMEFVDLLNKVEYVVTTTFHGTIFSFLEHTKFVAVPFSQKVVDVLQKVGLSHQIVENESSYNTFCNKLLNFSADYQKVDTNVYEWGRKSKALLEKSLNM